MSSSDIAMSVRGLSKSYTIVHGQQRRPTFRDLLMDRLRNPFKRSAKETFWALKDVSFDIKKGEVVGIIGRNGAGKSTLLKILSRITEPTGGEIDLYGRVGSLLEVGTGFHPELTGRENIFLNGAILGMNRAEIRRQFDAIVDFAEVEKFLDTPVKRYSSGMYVRLAFAVAAHLDPEILLVDEVLAVGDGAFQKKCLGKMSDIARNGRTVIFVSHSMEAITRLCTSAIYMGGGQLINRGPTQESVQLYLESAAALADISDDRRREGTGEYRVRSVRVMKNIYKCHDPKSIEVTVRRLGTMSEKAYISLAILDAQERVVSQCDSRVHDFWLGDEAEIRLILRLETPWLKPDTYRVDVAICGSRLVDFVQRAAILKISPDLPYAAVPSSDSYSRGIVLSDFSWSELDKSVALLSPTGAQTEACRNA